MFGLFKRARRNDERDIEKVLFDIAEHGRKRDHRSLFDLMKDELVYVPVVEGSLPEGVQPGEKIVTDDNMSIQIGSVQTPDGQTYLPASTRDDHPILGENFVVMEWKEFLGMVAKIPNADGILLQGQTSYAGFDKIAISRLNQ